MNTEHKIETTGDNGTVSTIVECGGNRGIMCGFCQVQGRAARLATTGETWLYVFDIAAENDVVDEQAAKEAGDEPVDLSEYDRAESYGDNPPKTYGTRMRTAEEWAADGQRLHNERTGWSDTILGRETTTDLPAGFGHVRHIGPDY